MQYSSDQHLISFVAHNAARVESHRHHCFQIIVSLRGTFSCDIAGQAFQGNRGFVVNQSVPHSCQAGDASALIFFLDAESYQGWQLKQLLADQPLLEIEALLTESQLRRIQAEANPQASTTELKHLAADVLAALIPAPGATVETLVDERVRRALDLMDSRPGDVIRLEDIAEVMRLSPERARHLFAQATGAPFSQYMLWRRIRQVIVTALPGRVSLTEAALQAGFTDQAHFCHVFKRIFGMSPKHLLKNSRFIQFLNPAIE